MTDTPTVDDAPTPHAVWWHRLLLWGLADRRRDAVLTATAALLVIVSRFGLLASGPWEWDETIFARGMLHFELAAHFPQPPGFPGFLALGHLLLPLAGTPYAALQWVSAIASIIALWPLAAIGRKVAPAAVASSAALLVLFLPGPWLFSVRGFSTTAAATFTFAAVALWCGGLDGRRVTWFSLLLTASFLVRPILLPTVGLLWLAGISTVKPLRRMVPGLTASIALVVLAVVVMVRLEGGWAVFVEPFVTHAEFHTDRLHRNLPGIENLGLVKGVGGVVPAALLLAAALLGVVAWGRRVGARAAATWLVVGGLTITQLVMLQNRSYARYAVIVQMGAAPLLAGAAAMASPPLAVIGLLGLAGAAAWSSYPLLEEQHREHFGAWQATVDAARLASERDWAVIVEPEVHVFSSYWWHVLEWRGEPTTPMVLTPRAPEEWQGVDRPWLVATVHPHLYMPSLTGTAIEYGEVSAWLRPLTQGRFLSAAVIDNPPLPVGRWWSRGELPDGSAFMWAGARAELWLPPVPRGTRIGVALRPAPGELPVRIEINASEEGRQVDGRAPPTWLWTTTTRGSASSPVIVRLSRGGIYPPGSADDRPLAVQLRGVEVRPPGASFGGTVASESDRARLGLDLEGSHPPEAFGALGRGVWLHPEARLRLVLDEPGRLRLLLTAPRPTPPRPRILRGGETVAGPLDLGAGATSVAIELSATDVAAGTVELEIQSDELVPAEAGIGADTRSLGIVLLGIEFEPLEPSDGWWRSTSGR